MQKSSRHVDVQYFVAYLTLVAAPDEHYKEYYVDRIEQAPVDRGTYITRRLAFYCIDTVDCVCQPTRVLL